MDTPCVITHQRRCISSTMGAPVRLQRSLPVGNLSPSMLCSPSRTTQAAAGQRLSAERNISQQLRCCRSPDTWAYRSQQHLTSTHRTCCTLTSTHNLDIQSTAARRSPTSPRVVEHFTHKVNEASCSHQTRVSVKHQSVFTWRSD